MAKFVPTKQNAIEEKALHKVCVDIYVKVLGKLEELGWKEIVIAADGFGVCSRFVDGKEYILNISLFEILIKHQPVSTRPTAFDFDEQPSEYKPDDTVSTHLLREIETLPEWVELQEPVKEWEEYYTQYWDY